jgi:hypothetical protein
MIEPMRGGSAGTGLVPVRPRRASPEPARVEPLAPLAAVRIDRRSDFLAQLIATRDDLAQARARRRADPGTAAAAYEAASRRRPETAQLLAEA